jgi:hypothetical protein
MSVDVSDNAWLKGALAFAFNSFFDIRLRFSFASADLGARKR